MAKLGPHDLPDINPDVIRTRLVRTGKRLSPRSIPNPFAPFHFLRSGVSVFTVGLTALFLVAFFGLLSIKIYKDYEAALTGAERSADAFARMSASGVSGAFDAATTALLLLDEASPSLGTVALQSLARTAEQKSPMIDRLIIVDETGKPMDDAGPALTATETAALNHAATSGFGISNRDHRVLFPVSHDGYLTLAKPLSYYDGERRWAVALIKPSTLRERIAATVATAQFGRTGMALLMENSGKTLPLAPSALRADQQITLEHAVNPLKEKGKSSVGYLSLEDGDLLFARRTLAGGGGLDQRQPMELVVLVPVKDATSTFLASRPLLLGFALSALLFAFAFASFLTRQVRRAETTDEMLEQSEQLFDLAATSAKCGIWNWNVETEDMFWSSSIMDLLGFDSGGARLTFNQALGLLHPSDRKYLRRVEVGMKNGQREFDTKFRLKHADGHFLWMRARGEVKVSRSGSGKDAPGETSEDRIFYGIIIDMTDELMAQAREEQARVTLRNAVENISDSFALWDRTRAIILTNSRYETLTPFTVDEAWQALDEDLEVQQANGRWLHIKSNRISGGAVVTLARDITDLKLKNAALEESRSALTETVADLKKSRSHLKVLAQKFEEEKRRAEEANRSKTEFLANMSHELRTPLNAIIGFSEIMETGMFGPLGDDRYEEYAADIRRSGRGLLELIDDILDMSRIESGKYEVECEPLETGQMVDDCLRLVEARAEEKNITIEKSIDAGDGRPPRIFGDKGAYKHVLLNVLSNAVKFTETGGTIHLTSQVTDQTVTILIEDTGQGIEKDNLGKLGMPFVQFESHVQKRHQGSGLGLAISMSLMEMMEGNISIDSEPGKGTRVAITMPRRQSDVA